MAYYKLKEEHPTMKKVRELEKKMEELDITIHVGVGNQLFVEDTENGYYAYMDSELSVGGYESTTMFPIPFESKLVTEKD